MFPLARLTEGERERREGNGVGVRGEEGREGEGGEGGGRLMGYGGKEGMKEGGM